MRVLVTRPAGQAAGWVERLRAAGLDAAALPLIDIGPPTDTAAVEAAWRSLGDRALVVFVSPNAVERFFTARPADVAGWPAGGPRAAAPGPGSAAALAWAGVDRHAIVEPAADAPQFDSESLWAVLSAQPWHGLRVLIVRGEGGGRDWLAARLAEAGASVEFVAGYRRAPPALDAAGRRCIAEALREPGAHLWWFSSSEAIEHLAGLAPAGTDWSGARALATHPRIAERARRLGFGRVDESRPDEASALDAIRRSIESPGR